MVFLNTTDTIGQILMLGSTTTTGELFLTLMLVFMILLAVCLFFQIPFEFSIIILLPLCLSTASYYSLFLAPLGVILIYIATVIAKNWLFR